MPIVKQSWVKSPEALEKYLAKDRGADTVMSASEGVSEEMAKSIRTQHDKHGTKAKNLALTIIQSWHENESDLASPDKYNQMGQELAKRLAPGHKAWVVTHTEKNHIHNHIVICSANSETGKLLVNKRSELVRLHEINNEIARENGFSQNKARAKSPEANLSPEVRSLVNRGKKSWVFDLVQKADFATAGVTSFDEYVGVMKMLGVHVRVEDKNISYFYGDHTKAVRGKTLGNKFNKEGLMKAFKENDERFAKDPALRSRIHADLGAAFDGKGNLVGTPSNLLLESTSNLGFKPKDYGSFTKIDRRRTRDDLPSAFDERGGPLYQEMKKAREVSIFDYCREQNIKLTTNKSGQTVLHGKEFVVINEKEWKNTKNGRLGTIIDFVKIHDETTELRAIAKINKNPRLLLLEPYWGQYSKGVQSFYFPKPKAASPAEARKIVSAFTRARGMADSATDTLLKSDRVHIGHDRSIWLLGEKNESALEFREERDGKWNSKRHGKPTGAFLEHVASGRNAVVHRDPFAYLLSHHNSERAIHKDVSHFVFLDENSHRQFDEFLALHQHITDLHIAYSSRTQEHEQQREFAHSLTAKFDPFDIRVHGLSRDLGMSKSKGPEIGF
ncbi:MAG: relaxase/mobilization nuclease domain-containing protein [Pseudobdellovibrionaceae bacterium]